MGHEASGTVDRVGDGLPRALLGSPIVLNPLISCGSCPACLQHAENLCPEKVLVGCIPEMPGAFADQMVVPWTAVVPWTGGAPLHWGAFAEPFAVGVHAAGLADLRGRTVTIIGAGAIGLCVALSARLVGATSVAFAQVTGERRSLVEGFGFEVAGAQSRETDVVFDCVATSETLAAALRLTRRAGSTIVVGFGSDTTTVPMTPLVHGERVLRGCAQYTRADFETAVRRLSECTLDVAQIVSTPEPLESAISVFRRLADGVPAEVRVLIAP